MQFQIGRCKAFSCRQHGFYDSFGTSDVSAGVTVVRKALHEMACRDAFTRDLAQENQISGLVLGDLANRRAVAIKILTKVSLLVGAPAVTNDGSKILVRFRRADDEAAFYLKA